VRDELLAYFESHHRLVEEPALEMILGSPRPWDLSQALVTSGPDPSPFVTLEMVRRAMETVRPPPPREGPPRPYQLLSDPDPLGIAGPLEGVQALLKGRFQRLSRILRGRPELADRRPLTALARAEGETAIIAMLSDVRVTQKAHHRLLSLEDESGTAEVLVPRDLPEGSDTFLPDEVLGLTVLPPRKPGGLAVARAIYRPDVPARRTLKRAHRPSRVLFLSDLHIGSKGFLTEPWLDLVEFLKGRGPSPPLVEGLEHVVIAGDLVDGIGVYPGQEADLTIPDVVEQYAELGRRLRELPSHLNILAVPGNHDAVCPAEPQPALPPELARALPPNVHILPNPSTFLLEGLVVTAYHGRSFDEMIPRIPNARYEEPLPVMRRMLSMRHLGPTYGGKTPLTPRAVDGLVLDPLPDIFVTGHTHTYGVERWRGSLLINASTWLEETEYQRMRNIRPDPAKATLVDLMQGSVRTIDLLGRQAPTAPALGAPEDP
jgi:DNA polymerase II small subunit